jgi:hypothetical protein
MSRNALFELRTKHAELLEKKTEQRIEELVKQATRMTKPMTKWPRRASRRR